MKKTLFLILFVVVSLAASAQLKVTSDGKVIIASNATTTNSSLQVGGTSGIGSYNIGISGSTTAMSSNNNIGVLGSISANSGFSTDKNYGVLGVVSPINSTHGRNFGLCGMIGFTGNHYGGAGVYGTNYTYCLSVPDNIQGDYAGYFHGPVKVTGGITTSNMYIPSDSRLSENVTSLNERGSATSTLDNLLGMNVIQYNMKSRVPDEIPADMEDSTENVRKAYEYLKKDEMKMSARRHFGIDAEELQKIYPDLVLEGQDGYLAVNYMEMVPLLIRSIQELKQELDAVKGDSKAMTRSFNNESADFNAPATGNVLYQNTPNPFKEQTTIRFSLVSDVQDASICIFDMTGKMLNTLPISSGDSSVSINGWELGEGMFLYSLIVNGQIIDTKKMLITK